MDELKLEFDDSEVIKSLDRIEQNLLDVAQQSAETANAMSESAKDAQEGYAALSKEVEKTATKTAQAGAQAESAAKSNSVLAASIKETILGYQIAGRSVAEWGQGIKQLTGAIQAKVSALGSGTGAVTKFIKVIGAGALGIVGILASAIAGLIGYFTKFQSGIDKVSRVVPGFNAVVTVLIDRATGLASAIGNVFSGNFSQAWEDAKGVVSGLGSALVDAASRAYDLEARFQSLRNTILTTEVEVSRQRVELEKLNQVIDDETSSYGKRSAAITRAYQIEKDIAGKRVEIAATDLDLKREALALESDNAAKKEEFAQAEISLNEAISEQNTVLFSLEAKRRELNKQAAEERAKQSKERQKQLEDEVKLLEKIRAELDKIAFDVQEEGLDKQLESVNRHYDEMIKTTSDGIAKLKEIEKRRALKPEELAAIDQANALQVEIEAARLNALTDLLTEYNRNELAQQREIDAEKLNNARESLERIRDLRELELDLANQLGEGFLTRLEANGAKEEEISKARNEIQKDLNIARLENQLEYYEEILKITDAGETQAVNEITLRIAALKQEIENALVEPIPGKKPTTIWSILGIDDDAQKEALKEAVGLIVNSLNQIADARVKEAEAAVDAADKKVKAAEDALAKEQELLEQGFANDTDLRKRELEEAKKARELAAKEQEKAIRAQILLDSAQQLSSLISASANLYKSFSALPFGAGILIATIVTAAMFGAFAKAKIDALKAVNVPKLRKGRKIEGRTHEEGGEIVELERDEWVIGTEHSREHDQFLKELNKGTFKGLDLIQAIGGHRHDDAMGGAAAAADAVQEKRREFDERRTTQIMVRAYNSAADRIVGAIQAKPTVYPLPDGYIKETERPGVIEKEIVKYK